MAADGTSALAAALAAGLGQRFGEDDPPAQFLHLDDLAVGRRARRRATPRRRVQRRPRRLGRRRAGACADRQRPRIQLPDRVTEVIGSLRWRFQRGPDPARPAQLHPLAVAGRQRPAEGEGWTPTVTNEQAYVEGTEAKWWTMVTPKRRQELSLGAMVGGIVVA